MMPTATTLLLFREYPELMRCLNTLFSMVVSCAEALGGDFQEREHGNFLQSVREDRTQHEGGDCTAVPSLNHRLGG